MRVGFPDPARATGTEAEVLAAFRQGRDALREQLVPLLREKYREKREKLQAYLESFGWRALDAE
jgi:hypothetical protein